MNTPIFVISLKSALARRERFLGRANAEGIKVEILDAHTELSADLTYDPGDALTAKGRMLERAELGVYSSHYSIWKRIVQDRLERAFIFEDDTVVDWAMIPELAGLPDNFNRLSYLRLFAKRPCRMKILSENLSGGRSLVNYRGYAYGTQAYLMTRGAAEQLISHCSKVRMAIDDEMDRSWEHGIPNIAVFPFPAFEENVPSTIGPQRFDQANSISRYTPQRLRFRVVDRMMRLRQNITRFGIVDRLDCLK